MIGAAGLGGKAVHDGLNDAGYCVVVRIAGFTSLEKDVGILRRAADDGAIGAQSVLPVFNDVLVVEQGADSLVRDRQNLADFMRRTEAVEKVHERNAGFESGNLRHQCHIGNFLDRVGSQHRPTGGPTGHHVGMVAKDRKRVRSQRAGRHVHRGRGQLTRNLEHVGDHQQQALRGCECGPESAGLQCAVECARGATLTLQFFHNGQRAPDILFSFGAPLISPFGHRRRGGDGVDGDDFGETIGNRSSSLVPIHNYHVLFTHSLCLIARPSGNNRYAESRPWGAVPL